MRILRALFVLVILLICSSPVLARIEPSFQVDYASWESEFVVVAEPIDLTRGKFTVIECWKGNLLPKQIISLPFFADILDKFDNKIYKALESLENHPQEDQQQSTVTNSRMIFFLNSSEHKQQIEFSDKFLVNSSTAWIEDGMAYAFGPYGRTGESRIVPLELSEAQFKEKVMTELDNQSLFTKIQELPECNNKIDLLVPYLQSEKYYIYSAAIEELKKCQQAALPTLWKLFNDESFSKHHDDIIKLIGETKHNDNGYKLTAIVTQELVFWQSIASELKENWWNGEGLEWQQVEEYRNRYGILLRTLEALEKMRYANCRRVVTELRDFWRSQPTLEDKTGIDQMSQTCDQLLNKISETKKRKD